MAAMDAAHDVGKPGSDDKSIIVPDGPIAPVRPGAEPESAVADAGGRLIFDLLKSQRRLLFLAAALATLAAAAELAPYWLVYRMTMEVAGPATPDMAQRLVFLAVLILGVAVTRLLLAGAAHISAHAAAFRLQRDLRSAFVRKLRHLPLGAVEGWARVIAGDPRLEAISLEAAESIPALTAYMRALLARVEQYLAARGSGQGVS